MDKNKEYKYGIKKIQKYDGNNDLIIDYLKKLKIITKKNNFYPGSPCIISNISNNFDKLFFCELHTNEYEILKKNLNKFTNIKVIKIDGFKYLDKVISKDKPYFILIDPSYEIKEDLERVNNILDNFYNKYTNSKIIIWYPILNYSSNDIFIENIRKKGLSNLINAELPIYSDENFKGMKGSGLLLLNFKEKKILKDLKILLKDLSIILRENDDIFKPKVRYL